MTLSLGGPLILVGAGKMGGAMLLGWLERGLDPAATYILDPAPAPAITELTKERGINLATKPEDLPADAAVMVLAVKPQIMDDVLAQVSGAVASNTVVLSIAAGKTLASLAGHLGSDTAIVRSMPNTPAAIGRGITVACASATVSDRQKEICVGLLQAAGTVAWTEDEALLDPVTAVSGSGPAYVFLLAECLEEAGVQAGLDRGMARLLARETVSGAGELLHQSDEDAAVLRQNVTSPGGTTAAALEVLMASGGVQELLTKAVKAASERSRELSS